MNMAEEKVSSIEKSPACVNFHWFVTAMMFDRRTGKNMSKVYLSEDLNHLFNELAKIVGQAKKELVSANHGSNPEITAAAFDDWLKVKMPLYYAMAQEKRSSK